MTKSDYIIAGGGAAGLSLAFYLVQSASLQDKTILIIDRDSKKVNDRTWCFWEDSRDAPIFPELVSYSWDTVQFVTEERVLSLPLTPYKYRLIRSDDFYTNLIGYLKSTGRVQFVQSKIQAVYSEGGNAYCRTEDNTFEASYVFSSLYEKPDNAKLAGHLYMLQHFVGKVVQVDRPVFDSKLPVFMDFRVTQVGFPTFMYVLPFSDREALVEYTVFSPELLPTDHYHAAITAYMQNYYGVGNFEVVHEERGAIPMTDYAFPAGDGRQLVTIGSAAGMSKASTGYTFYRIQKHAKAIVQHLEQKKSPLLAQPSSAWKLKMDRLMLHQMYTDGNQTWRIFQKLFENNPTPRVMSFLNEETSYMEDFLIMQSVPPAPFLKAIYQTGWSLL
jgi:lycopene beta-cyclase